MTGTEIRIRPATLDDYGALIALFDELDELHRQARPDFFRPFPGPARSRTEVERWLREAQSTVLVAEGEGRVVGLALLLTRPSSSFVGAVPRKVIEVDNIVVTSSQRSLGVGHSLLAAARDWARGQQATHIEVAVHAFNHDARRFYEDFGFRPSIDRLVMAA